jgi:hypothetical protein
VECSSEKSLRLRCWLDVHESNKGCYNYNVQLAIHGPSWVMLCLSWGSLHRATAQDSYKRPKIQLWAKSVLLHHSSTSAWVQQMLQCATIFYRMSPNSTSFAHKLQRSAQLLPIPVESHLSRRTHSFTVGSLPVSFTANSQPLHISVHDWPFLFVPH